MTILAALSPPFGTYALSPDRERWRKKADGYTDTPWGRMMISRARKKALAGQTGPFDVEIYSGLKARLYPTQNRCEKRAFAGVHIWDRVERNTLKDAIEACSYPRFIFLDVGANVGLYSIFATYYGRASRQNMHILAVEPGLETCARLEANIAANAADIQIVRAAVSDTPGQGYLSTPTQNRGEAKLVERSDDSGQEDVIVDTLARICRVHGLARIDAMKLDIEGHDLKALTGFFNQAPESLHPALLILETGAEPHSPLIELCVSKAYMITARVGLNTILTKRRITKEAQ